MLTGISCSSYAFAISPAANDLPVLTSPNSSNPTLSRKALLNAQHKPSPDRAGRCHGWYYWRRCNHTDNGLEGPAPSCVGCVQYAADAFLLSPTLTYPPYKSDCIPRRVFILWNIRTGLRMKILSIQSYRSCGFVCAGSSFAIHSAALRKFSTVLILSRISRIFSYF